MTRDEFWASTPRLFNEMLKRYSEVQQHLDWRSGAVALPLYNWGRKKHDPDMVYMKDLFPSFAERQKKATPEDHAAAFESWAAVGFGKVVKLNA